LELKLDNFATRESSKSSLCLKHVTSISPISHFCFAFPPPLLSPPQIMTS
jgi:hypothetical protein